MAAIDLDQIMKNGRMTEFRIPFPWRALASKKSGGAVILASGPLAVLPFFTNQEYAREFIRRSNLDVRIVTVCDASDALSYLDDATSCAPGSRREPFVITFDQIELSPAEGTPFFRTEDLVKALKDQADTIE